MFRYIFPKTSVNLKPTTSYTPVAFTPTRSRTAAPGDIPSFFLRNTLNLTVIQAADRQLKKLFPVEQVVLFGSVARGEAVEGSDIDLLVITSKEVNYHTRNLMSDLIFELNFTYGTNLSIVVVDADSWNHGIMTLMPLHQEIQSDGVYI